MNVLSIKELIARLQKYEEQNGPETYVGFGFAQNEGPALLGIHGNVVDICHPIFSSYEKAS